MPQLLIPLTVVSFAIGMTAFVLCLLIHLARRSAVTRYLLILQALIAYAAFYFFSVNSLRSGVYGSTADIVAWHCAGHVWSGFFCYYYCLFIIRLTDTVLAERWRKLLIGACAALALSFAVPFLSSGDSGYLVDRINYQNSFIVFPLDLAAVLAGSLVELAAMRRMPETAAKRAIRIDLGVKAIMIPCLFAAMLLESRSVEFWDTWTFAFAHAYLLAWNCLVLVNAARVVRSSSEPSLAGSRTARGGRESRSPAEPGQGLEAEARAELEGLRRAMQDDKAYLDAGLTLPALAERLAMPRNRLSRLLNEAIGKSYNDYINEYRVQEAKNLLSSPEKGLDVLSVAFESGFNSKATFYAAFKKVAGMTPNEFRASVSRPKG